MEYRRFGNKIVARIDKGEEIMASAKEICEKENVTLAQLSALGALESFSVGFFDTDEKKYYGNDYKIHAEITSLWGTVSTMDGELYFHVHMSAADRYNRLYGGHLVSAVVSATCEMVIDVIDGKVEREFSPEIGLNLYKFLDR